VSFNTLKRTQELVIQAQDGDSTALEQLCRIYTERVRRICEIPESRPVVRDFIQIRSIQE